GRAARVAQYRAASRHQRRAATMSLLPLDSPNWMPAAEAHRMLTGLLGDPDLAAKDLTAAVADKRSDKRLPCMPRAIASHIAPDQDREIVPLSFWDKYAFAFDPVSEKLHILTKGFNPQFCCRVAFFVWKPEFERIWPALAASATPHAASSARDDEPTPAPTARTDRRVPGPQPELRWRTDLA